MAIKQVVVSDLSGRDIPDDKHARILIIEHPELRGTPVELDVTDDEASKFESTQTELVHLIIHQPNRPTRQVAVELSAFNTAFKNVDMNTVIGNGRRTASEQPRQRRARGTAKSAGEKIDYRAMENIGLEHRGRVTDAEAELVRNNLEQANENRARQGQAPIDPADPKMKARYKF